MSRQRLGRWISASMQRTPPPPNSSMTGIETIPSSGRHGDDGAGRRGEFQDVAGEPGHLAHRYLEDRMSGGAQFLRHGAPMSAIGDRLAAEHRKTAADR